MLTRVYTAPAKGQLVRSLPASSNILSTTVASLSKDESSTTESVLIATTADRRLHILDLPSFSLHASHASLSDAPILSCMAYSSAVLLCTTMSGTLIAINPKGEVLDKRKDHSKYVIGCAVFRPSPGTSSSSNGALVATAGWDNKVHVYRPSSHAASAPSSLSFRLGEPTSTLALPTKPEALLILPHPETGDPILLLSRTDSNFLHYYTIPTTASSPSTEPSLLGKQNLAPHSNAWVAFTPSSLALHPSDPTLLAVGTNSLPHMKVLIVRLLVPPLAPIQLPSTLGRPSLLDDPAAPPQETQASQARAALAIADREHAAIVIHVNTMAPQTAYSTPCVVWRADGSGVWVNGDDGVVRGVERVTGKVIASLKGEGAGDGDGHEAGSKVRCLAAGIVGKAGGDGSQGGHEVLVSGGFDQRLVVWQ